MFDYENEVYNPQTKRYELIDVELPDDYYLKDENGEWVELYPIPKPSDDETIAAEMQDAFPFEIPSDEDIEKMAVEFKNQLKKDGLLFAMEY